MVAIVSAAECQHRRPSRRDQRHGADDHDWAIIGDGTVGVRAVMLAVDALAEEPLDHDGEHETRGDWNRQPEDRSTTPVRTASAATAMLAMAVRSQAGTVRSLAPASSQSIDPRGRHLIGIGGS